MSKAKTGTATDRPMDGRAAGPMKDAVTQIREKQDEIVCAVIQRAIDEGSYQAAKWLFEIGGITPAEQGPPQEQPSLMRLFLDQLQIPESPEEIAAEFSANDPAVE